MILRSFYMNGCVMLLMRFQIKEDILMRITDWDEWMKAHHIKICTEEELRKKRMLQTTRKAIGFLKKHKTEIVKAIGHASET